MEQKVTIVTLSESLQKNLDRDERHEWKRISCLGRHENHQLILQYSNKFPLKPLYPPDIRAMVDGNWVIAQKVADLSERCIEIMEE